MNFISKFFNYSYFKKNAPSAFKKTYQDMENSKAYKKYCQELHGTDYRCLNTLSKKQYLKLKEIIKEQSPELLLDIGSGNGKLTSSLAREFNFKAHGIDFALCPSDEAGVTFSKDDIESFKRNETYDLIISIDSFYMIRNYRKFLKNLKNHLGENKKIILFFTLVNNSFNNSPIPKALAKLRLNYEITEFSEDDLQFWQKSRELLDEMNDEFVDENHFKLWNIKKKEADKNISLHSTQQTHRYLLIIN
ncbi:hypothetical protein A9Q84_01915 [Halobacteriovorax marinus]|uniref:Methyltransferase domain-containing protein n=1 Tax=Halobacteriovorax marinus TaxID=97084 RepID=A0A1Y5FCF5_9BACT|nr:hypothetical protein A9Q84_01915 [Halobacteriovorax marinus]